MDMSDILKLGVSAFQNKLGDSANSLDSNTITDALSTLLGNSEGSGFDLGSIISSFSEGGLGDIVSSWLGDGDNEAISSDQLIAGLGEDKISEFASKLGIDTDTALSGLSDALPNIIDKSSSGGSLLDSIGGIGGALNMAGKLFGR